MDQNNADNRYNDEVEPEPEESQRAREILEVYDRTITSDLNDPAQWYDLGVKLAQSGWSEPAVASIVKSLELRAEQPKGWYQLGLSLVELVRFKDAVLAFDRALMLDPSNPDIWLNKGKALEVLDQPDEAREAYNKCLEADAHNAEALYLKAVITEDTADEKLEGLLDIYDKILKRNPRDSRAWFNKAFVLAEMFKSEEAMTAFESFLELHPDDMQSLTRVGLVLHGLAMNDEALLIFKDVLKLNPKPIYIQYQ